MARKRTASPRIELLRPHAGDPNMVDIRAGGRTLATLPRTRAEELGAQAQGLRNLVKRFTV